MARPADKVPDPQARETFERSRLNWNEIETEQHASMLDFYRRLIAIRKTTPKLTDPDLSNVQVTVEEAQSWFTMRRGQIVLAVSFADLPLTLPLPRGTPNLILATHDSARLDAAGALIPPVSAALFRITPPD